jgi:hypothetical protein
VVHYLRAMANVWGRPLVVRSARGYEAIDVLNAIFIFHFVEKLKLLLIKVVIKII